MKGIFFLITLFPSFCLAQKGFFLGVQGNTGLYWLYNYNDFHSSIDIEASKRNPKKCQDYQLGFRFEYGLSQRSRLSFDLSFQNFRQDYRQDFSSGAGKLWWNVYSKLNYASMASNYLVGFFKSKNSKVFPYIKGGVHISYLMHFFEYSEQTSSTDIYLVTNDNGNLTFNNLDKTTGIREMGPGHSDPIYHKLIYGVNGGMGVMFKIIPKLNIGIDLSGLYSLRNIDNLKAKTIWPGIVGNSWTTGTKLATTQPLSERKTTHNIYLGLGLSLTYFIPSKKSGDLPCPPKR